MIEDHRPLVDDFIGTGNELLDTYTHEDGQTVHSEVTQVTSKYDQVKHAIRDKLRQLNTALRAAATDVSSSTW